MDENLSWRLIRALESEFQKVTHVNSIGLSSPISDVNIWNYAKEHKLTIVTNDEDFLHLLFQKGFPPKVILMKIGNKPTNAVVEALLRNRPQIMEMIQSDSLGILEIY
ncbi:MAG: DUF5615 family PIN-like protein [Flavobacteriales bacterium]|nr:DUF5615 family PIN-like protein [Flavobacteriales bacterium]